jgi:predicted small metal-binding protein
LVAREEHGLFASSDVVRPRVCASAAYLVDFAVQRSYRVCVSQIVEGCNMKVLKCGDLNPGCSFVAKGKDENEVLQQAAQHAKADHGIATIPPDMLSAVRGAIHEEK